ncbi:hypothetical protein, partial [uncultured Clostridium sp.]|uniref:hypothetical protein n=1 Tax=uncultured Clostridium sp. TaxID=59620 RepID=UPI00263976B5
VPDKVADGKHDVVVTVNVPVTPVIKTGIVKVDIIGKDGEVISTTTKTEKIGNKIDIPAIPSGSKVDKVDVNGKTVDPSEVPTVVTSGTTVITYHTSPIVKPEVKEVTVTINVVGKDGKVITTITKTEKVGTKIDIPTISNGSKLTKIDVNGKIVDPSEVPTVVPSGTTVITYHTYKTENHLPNPNKDINDGSNINNQEGNNNEPNITSSNNEVNTNDNIIPNIQGNNTNSDLVNTATMNSKEQKTITQLPDTGIASVTEGAEGLLGLLSLSLASGLSIFGFKKFKNKKDDDNDNEDK